MAFDGVTIANIVSELREKLIGGRLYKIAQPEEDELLLTVRQPDGQYKLLLSANASLPLIYLTQTNKPGPLTAPNFCMLLRKHLQNGRIIDISQPGLERIVHIRVEHLDEMGDLCRKTLIIEIMGKHSNIIFCGEDNHIIDSIKRVSAAVSSLREVLPGKPYFIAGTQDKKDALQTDFSVFREAVSAGRQAVSKALYGSFAGISPALAGELCFEAGISGDLTAAALTEADYKGLFTVFTKMVNAVKEDRFAPNIAYMGGRPVEFSALPLQMYSDRRAYASMSELIEAYYAEKAAVTRIRQKSADLRHIVQTALERNVRKYELQLAQMRDTEKKDLFRLYGELLNACAYSARPGVKSLETLNYYTNETVSIPLDPSLSATENARQYFEKYNKLKRTYEALSQLTIEVNAEIEHLESIANSLDIAMREEDLTQIREELAESGYIRHRKNEKKQKIASRPFHYISSDGFHMYVGKNNYQNDELTFKVAAGGDWWFHAKKIPGSHVIVRTEGAAELPDATFEEAARLAAYYSKGRGQEKVEIDYVQKKHVKKPAGAKPGFVVYYTNFSMAVPSDISGILLVQE